MAAGIVRPMKPPTAASDPLPPIITQRVKYSDGSESRNESDGRLADHHGPGARVGARVDRIVDRRPTRRKQGMQKA